jgi:hypothetical protein
LGLFFVVHVIREGVEVVAFGRRWFGFSFSRFLLGLGVLLLVRLLNGCVRPLAADFRGKAGDKCPPGKQVGVLRWVDLAVTNLTQCFDVCLAWLGPSEPLLLRDLLLQTLPLSLLIFRCGFGLSFGLRCLLFLRWCFLNRLALTSLLFLCLLRLLGLALGIFSVFVWFSARFLLGFLGSFLRSVL